MNTANEQTLNLTNNLQNSNLTNSGSKKFTRDYDKEPIIIKDKIKLLNFMIIALSFIFLFFFMYIFEIRSNIRRYLVLQLGWDILRLWVFRLKNLFSRMAVLKF